MTRIIGDARQGHELTGNQDEEDEASHETMKLISYAIMLPITCTRVPEILHQKYSTNHMQMYGDKANAGYIRW